MEKNLKEKINRILAENGFHLHIQHVQPPKKFLSEDESRLSPMLSKNWSNYELAELIEREINL